MNAPEPARGRHLVRGGRRFASGGGIVARLFARAFAGVLDRVDAGLAHGSIVATLPDGSGRVLGGRRPGPLAEVELRSWRALVRLARSGSVGWYVAWDKDEWTSPDPVPLFDLFMRNRVALGRTARAGGVARAANRVLHAMRRNTPVGARRNVEAHYDLGNDFYAAWLDAGMSYSSAIWGKGDTLETAQTRKIAALLDRLDLKPGDSLLDIGSGWGAVAEAAAERGLDVAGITLSPAQKDYAVRRLKGRERFLLSDYRNMRGVFDGIASVEMVEAVGQEYWPAWLDAVGRLLKPGGRAAVQFILIADDIFESYAANADFIQTYVFPGGLLISVGRFRALAEARGFAWTDERRFGLDYAETLKAWRARFDAAVSEGRLPRGFDAHFVRLWRYYLMYCEGGFRGGGIDVAQVTLIKGGDDAAQDQRGARAARSDRRRAAGAVARANGTRAQGWR
ncbi:MAG: class I SAM-dependent methyltransferase [Sphingomonadaceae bacterium]|nr:class I SAM-dependent methyltransferase [Sphingomonadaceae bacterium]